MSDSDEFEALLQFLYLCPVGLIQMDGAGAVEMMNPLGVQLLLPLAPGGDVSNLLTMLSDLAPEVPGLVKGFAGESGPICTGHRIQISSAARLGGDPTILSLTLLQIFPGRLMAVLSDISEQVAQERRIRQNEAWFAAIFNGVNDYAIYLLDADGRIESWNESGARLTGYAAGHMVGRPADLGGDSADSGKLERQLMLARRNGWHLEEGWCDRADGTRFWGNSLVSVLQVSGEERPGFCVVLRDMTERKQTLDDLRRLTTTDQLTGALNRYQFFEMAHAEQARWERYGHPLSGIMIDADHFKRVNDTYGHAAGDQVLRHLAGLCREELRELDILARLGGEEFAILLPATDGPAGASVAERLRRKLEERPVALEDGRTVALTASFGVSALGDQVSSIAALLKSADSALYAAKRAGRNRVVFEEASAAPLTLAG